MRVGLGIPILDSVPGEVFGPMLSLAVEMGRKHSFVFIPTLNTTPHDKARESIVDRAIDNGCEVLFFVDSDMALPKDAFDILLAELQSSGAQVAAGHTYRRGYPYTSTWSVRAPDGQVLQAERPKTSLSFPVAGCGMACTLVDLDWCVRSLPRPFFYQGMVKGEYVWEDWYFCSLVAANGGSLIGVPSVRTGHLLERRFVDDSNCLELRKQYLQDELASLPPDTLVAPPRKEASHGRCESDICSDSATVVEDRGDSGPPSGSDEPSREVVYEGRGA